MIPGFMPHSSLTERAGAISRVQLFATCLVDQFYPQAAWATVAVLERLGLTVEVPLDQTCCGQPAFNGGFEDEARAMARHTITTLGRSPAPIVVPSGSCAEMIVHQYPRLFAGDDTWGPRAAEVAGRTYELGQFLVDVLGVADVGAVGEGSIAYHASCHGLRGLGLGAQPRQLLACVAGAACRDLPGAERCCGVGGRFAVKMAPISAAMLQRKLDDIEASGAQTVVATDVSCLMHIGGGLHRRGSTVGVKHLAEVLSQGGPDEGNPAAASETPGVTPGSQGEDRGPQRGE
jgi:L-lactate dehydrogenase complex protein LldE